MKGNKILAVIALIALTGFLWMACSSDTGGGAIGEEGGEYGKPIGVTKTPTTPVETAAVVAPPTKTPEQILAIFARNWPNAWDDKDNPFPYAEIKDGKIIIKDAVSANIPLTSEKPFVLENGAEIKTNGQLIFLKGGVEIPDTATVSITGEGTVVVAKNSAIEGILTVYDTTLIVQDAKVELKNDGELILDTTSTYAS